MKMTKTEAERLVKHWQERLQLQHWVVGVTLIESEYVNEHDDVALITRNWFALDAKVQIASKRAVAEVEESVLHEMCHLLLADMHITFDNAVGELSRQSAAVAREVWNVAEEQCVARLVRLLDNGVAE